jgi:hypothetical protein
VSDKIVGVSIYQRHRARLRTDKARQAQSWKTWPIRRRRAGIHHPGEQPLTKHLMMLQDLWQGPT